MCFFVKDQIGLTPEQVISKIMANPDVAMGFQNPRVQAAIMDVCSQTQVKRALYGYILNLYLWNNINVMFAVFSKPYEHYQVPK